MELRNKLIATLGALGIAAGAVVGLSDTCLKVESFVVQNDKLCLTDEEYVTYKQGIVDEYNALSPGDKTMFAYKEEIIIPMMAVLDNELAKRNQKLVKINYNSDIDVNSLFETFFIPNP